MNVVHPVEVSTRTVYIDGQTGEVIEETKFRNVNQRLRLYEELYSMRDHLSNDRITIIIAKLKNRKTCNMPEQQKAGASKPLSKEKMHNNPHTS